MTDKSKRHLSDMRTDFRIEDPLLSTQFEDVLDDLLMHCPVAESQEGNGYYVINRYEDVYRCARDWKTFSSADGWQLNAPEGTLPILPEDSDPPYHNAWRRVLNPAFTRESVTKLEDFARAVARELLSGLIPKGGCDVVADFAAILPGRILFEKILPVPVKDLHWLFQEIDTFSFGALDDRGPAFARVHEYLDQFLRARAAQAPQGDVVDAIVAGVDKDGTACPWEDKVYVILDVVFGGLATTTHVMSGGLYHLAAHPDIRQRLIDDPSLLDQIVEEIIRLYPPVVAPARTVMADTEVAGVKLPAGTRVALNFAAAGRDPSAMANPGQVHLDQAGTVHTTFGVGPHRCLGEHLARLEVKVALDEFVRQIPAFDLQPGSQPVYESGQLRTMKNLQLQWQAP